MVTAKHPPCFSFADADSIRHSLPADSYDRDMVDGIYYRGPLEASPAGILGFSDISPDPPGGSGETWLLRDDPIIENCLKYGK